MIVLGLLLLAAAVVAVVAAVTSNTGSADIHLWGLSISHLSVGVVFVVGMLTTVIGVLGLMLFAGGMRRGRRLRKEKNRLAHENRQLAAQAESGTAFDGTASGERTYGGTPHDDTARRNPPPRGTGPGAAARGEARASETRTDLPRGGSERVDPA